MSSDTTDAQAGQEVEVVEAAIQATDPRIPLPVRELLQRLDRKAPPEDGLNIAALNIMANILNAVTLAEIFEAADANTQSGDDFIDKPFRLRHEGIQWQRTAEKYKKTGFPFYALITVMTIPTKRDEPPREVTIACGGFSFVSVLDSLEERGYLSQAEAEGGMPLWIKAKAVASGQTVLLLQPFDIPF